MEHVWTEQALAALRMRVTELELDCEDQLHEMGIRSVWQLVTANRGGLIRSGRFKNGRLGKVRKSLARYGLTLEMTLPEGFVM